MKKQKQALAKISKNKPSAKAKKDSLSSKISKLDNQITVKSSEVDTHQTSIDQIKTEHSSVLSAFEDAQKSFYTIGSEIYEKSCKNNNFISFSTCSGGIGHRCFDDDAG